MKNNMDNEVEILAPAGSYEAFVAAVNAGAHAVYMGVNKFNARTMANNLSIEEYITAIDYAHKRNVKVYLTLNTLLLDSEIKEALDIVSTLYKEGLDAVIVQDIGIATLIHKFMPNLPLHASTQMSVLNLEQAKYLESLGFSRVVLGRELSVEEIEYITKNISMEVEIFVHGALCVSVSGQCMASALIGERSANRGSCAQPCRMKYSLYNESKKEAVIKDRYILSKKDIYGLDTLEALKNAGVKSFKIEGRNRTVEYTAGVVSRYRKAVDNNYVVENNTEKELLQLFNRSGKCDGYLNGVRYKRSISDVTPKNTGLYLGQVLAKKDKYIKIKLEEDIDLHDGVEAVTIDGPVSFVVTCIKDEKGNILNTNCKKGSIVYLGDVKGKVEAKDIVYKTSDNKLNKESREYLEKKEKQKRVEESVIVTIKKDTNISAKSLDKDIFIELEYIPEISKSVGVTEEKLKEVFSKTEDTATIFNNIQADIDEGLFVPVSKLNELRRALVEKIEESRLVKREEIIVKEQDLKTESSKKTLPKTTAIFMYRYNPNEDYIALCNERYETNLDKLYVPARAFKEYEKDILKYVGKTKVYMHIPNVILKNLDEYIRENIERLIKEGISGIVIGNVGYLPLAIELKEKYSIELIGEYTLNVFNSFSASHFKDLDIVTPIFETEDADIEKMAKIKNVELVEGLATAMTTRYCMLASFVSNAEEKNECKAVCKQGKYYIEDAYNKKYNIVPDSTDCITEIVRNKRKYPENLRNKYSVRYNIM
ncbi:MAG: U32 family peptidase [Clostridia bacterium]|nr:U32 family peptidase [Clostridia bacterium]